MPPTKRKRIGTPVINNEADSDCPTTVEKKKVRWEGKSRVTQTSTDDSEHSDCAELEDSKTNNKICLAACCSHGRVGCAYYDPIKCSLYVLEDTQETVHYDLTKMFLEQANPDIVLTSSKSDDEFIDVLREYMDTLGGMFQIRPHNEFVASKGQDRLLALSRLSELPQPDLDLLALSDIDSTLSTSRNAYDFMQRRRQVNGDPTAKRWNASIRIANFVNIESSPLCMATVGALLDHLVRERALSDFDDDGIDDLEVRDIEILALNQVMQINSDALLSLQIFENESHASVHSDKTKEGLSLFGILNNTKTTLGRSLMRAWLLRPSLSLSVINARHEAVACFMNTENIATAAVMHGHLNGIKNVPRILSVLKAGRAKLSDWQGLVKFTFHSTMLRDALSELHEANHVDVVQELMSSLDVTTFKEVGNKVNEIVDWAESTNAGRVCVRPNVDEELDNRKHVYHGIDSVLSKVAEQISQTVPQEFATSLNVVYFPQLGYLICVPMLDEWKGEAGIQTINDWTFQFSSDAYVYFKSQEMHDMDIHIGDLHSTIVDREIEIVQELLEEILPCHNSINQACDVCAELDCLLSFSEASGLYGFKRPEMVQANIIDIKQGRHPLQEQVVDTFVPNDAQVVGGAGINARSDFPGAENWNSVILCTGANACGKSVYLKQIAMIQFMAQIGCFVPADSATLGIVDKIFTRVSTRESVSKVQSAFMIDLNQVSLLLRNCTSRSLVVLDEFGKGTLSTDGAGIFCGVIQHLLNLGPNCPKVLVATHFHDVFNKDLLDPELLPISFRHMQVMFTSSSGAVLDGDDVYMNTSMTGTVIDSKEAGVRKIGPGEKITYLYRIAEGLSLDSHAAKCAEIFGIPSRMVDRARYVSHLISTHELGRLLDEEMTDEERADLEDAEAVCRRFLQWKLDQVEEGDDIKARLAQVLGRTTEDEN